MNFENRFIIPSLIVAYSYFILVNPVSHDARTYSNILMLPIPIIQALTVLAMTGTVYTYMKYSDSRIGLFLIIVSSIGLVYLTLLRQILGFLFLFLYLMANSKRAKWPYFLLTFTHIFSGITTLAYLAYRKSKTLLYAAGLITAFYLTGFFNWHKLDYIFRLIDFNSIDQASIILRIIATITVLTAIIIGEQKNREKTMMSTG